VRVTVPSGAVESPTFSRVDTLNVHAERNRLTPDALARWHGLPVGWFEAATLVHHRNFHVPRPLLALLDTGVAQARFDFGDGVKTYDLRAGALRVYDGHRACRLNDWSCHAARRIMVELDAGWLGDEPDALAGLRQNLDFRDDALAGLVRAMAREIAEGCPHGELYAETLSIGVLQRLMQTNGRPRRERGRLSTAQLGRIDALIVAESGSGPSLAAMAHATGYSRAQFVRLFRRSTGASPHRYVLEQRLAHARQLLAKTDLPLAAVATETGFASQSHLTRSFVRLYGKTPGEVRREAGSRRVITRQ
jgi:AraC family transcriptional regulator